ncbi:UNVERIFIED_CONTAM: hypothetical protein Sindi_0471100 [Sesamum indicum]
MIKAIMNLRSPTMVKELPKLTSKIASLNCFISRFADRNMPFFKVLRKTKNFECNEKCERALQDLKNYLTKPPLLANPKEGEVLFLYLAVSESAVNSVLGVEMRYFEMEKLALALVVKARKPCPYFQSHRIIVLTNHPLKHVMSLLEASGKFIKWGPEGVEIEVAARLSLPVTNNEAQYEALILGLELAHEAGARKLEVFTHSQLVALQMEGTTENDKENVLSKFGAAMSGIKDCKFTVIVQEKTMITEGLNVEVVSESKSWKDKIVKYLEEGILPNNPIRARRLKFQVARFTIVSDKLYKRIVDGSLLKCLNEERAEYVMKKIHEGCCGNHFGARLLA